MRRATISEGVGAARKVVTSSQSALDSAILLRRECCRRCSGMVVAHYWLGSTGDLIGWGGQATGQCGSPARCCEKLYGIDVEGGDLAPIFAKPGGYA